MHPDLGGPPAVLYEKSSLQLMDAGSEGILIYEELRIEYPGEISAREILPSHLRVCLPCISDQQRSRRVQCVTPLCSGAGRFRSRPTRVLKPVDRFQN